VTKSPSFKPRSSARQASINAARADDNPPANIPPRAQARINGFTDQDTPGIQRSRGQEDREQGVGFIGIYIGTFRSRIELWEQHETTGTSPAVSMPENGRDGHAGSCRSRGGAMKPVTPVARSASTKARQLHSSGRSAGGLRPQHVPSASVVGASKHRLRLAPQRSRTGREPPTTSACTPVARPGGIPVLPSARRLRIIRHQ